MPSDGPKCQHCGADATCFGEYEAHSDAATLGYACDNCCGHGNEDGWCKPVDDVDPRDRVRVLEADHG